MPEARVIQLHGPDSGSGSSVKARTSSSTRDAASEPHTRPQTAKKSPTPPEHRARNRSDSAERAQRDDQSDSAALTEIAALAEIAARAEFAERAEIVEQGLGLSSPAVHSAEASSAHHPSANGYPVLDPNSKSEIPAYSDTAASRPTLQSAASLYTAATVESPTSVEGSASLESAASVEGSAILEYPGQPDSFAPERRQADAVRDSEEPDPPATLERKIASGLAFLRRRITGDYTVDEFGFDPELVENVLAPAMQPLYKKWFRTEVLGVENIPAEGGALMVANHAGGLWALDGAITSVAVRSETPGHRNLRMLGADLIFTTPGLAPLARKSGATLACNADAERLLSQGQLVGVWPEGFKGIGKPFSERYKLQRFGRGGFVTAALRAGVPIIPISIVGSEEIHPVLGNAKTLARLLNVPYFPLTPTFPWLGPLGLIPFPSKWYIEFGEPIPTAQYGPDGADDPMLVFELTDRVRETIQSTLYRLLVKRRSVWR